MIASVSCCTDDRDAKDAPDLLARAGRTVVLSAPCPATKDGRGHHIAFCRVNGCRAAEIRPAGCTGAYGPTRAEWYEQVVRDRGRADTLDQTGCHDGPLTANLAVGGRCLAERGPHKTVLGLQQLPRCNERPDH